jgi:hypothetical protein
MSFCGSTRRALSDQASVAISLEPGTYVVEVDPSDTSTGTITVAVTSP